MPVLHEKYADISSDNGELEYYGAKFNSPWLGCRTTPPNSDGQSSEIQAIFPKCQRCCNIGNATGMDASPMKSLSPNIL